MSKIKNEIGNCYGLLSVIKKAETSKKGAYWLCKCECGNTTVVSGGNLRTGEVKSCGCLKHKKHNTHHLSKHKLYNVWYHIKRRCLKKSNIAYKDYGKRGISICDDWMNFETFYTWAINNGYQENLSIDRIDNNAGYSPENCRWTTSKVQCNNRRSCVMITYNGKTQNLMQWCEELNLNYKRIHNRLYKCKWSFEKAINTP